MQCFSFGFRKVSYTLLLRFSQKFVLHVLPHKHRVCAVLLPRQVCYMLAFILLYSVIFWFTCFASPTSGLCSAFPFGSPQVYTLLVFLICFIQFTFVMRALPNKLRFVQWFFPGSPRICTLYFFALCYSVLSLCSAFFPSLIYSSFASRKVGSSLLLHLGFYLVNLFGVFYFTLLTVVLFPRPL